MSGRYLPYPLGGLRRYGDDLGIQLFSLSVDNVAWLAAKHKMGLRMIPHRKGIEYRISSPQRLSNGLPFLGQRERHSPTLLEHKHNLGQS